MGFLNKTLKPDADFTQDLSAGSLSFTTAYGRAFRLEGVYIDFSEVVTETIIVTLDSGLGSDYDVILDQLDLFAEKDYAFRPNPILDLQANDKILITVTNANTTGIAYGHVKTSPLLK
jgi:hypothetical protein